VVSSFTRERKIEIVCEQLRDGLPVNVILEKYNINRTTFFYWKRTFFTKSNTDYFEDRMQLAQIKPRVILGGLNEDYFLKDCLIRDFQHGKMLRHIVDVYYSIMSNRPDMEGKEMDEIKRIINDKIKL